MKYTYERALDMRWEIAIEARRAELAITNLISNKREWNNCFIKNAPNLYKINLYIELYVLEVASSKPSAAK